MMMMLPVGNSSGTNVVTLEEGTYPLEESQVERTKYQVL
jgi:hypothetical protein